MPTRARSTYLPLALIATSLGLGLTPAHAGGHTTGGGGALGQVSSGIGQAVGGSGGSSGTNTTGGGGSSNQGTSAEDWVVTTGSDRDHRWRYVRSMQRPGEPEVDLYVDPATGNHLIRRRGRPDPAPHSEAVVDGYAGVQKVHDSDGAFSAELAVRDRRFRLAGSLTRFFEQRGDGAGTLTMTMPTLTGGVRIDDGGATRVFLEGGMAVAMTRQDPVMDSSITGALVGVRLEHAISRRLGATLEAREMWFSSGIRASAVRVGVHVGIVEASLRVVDFNVGPALYGPEVGVRF